MWIEVLCHLDIYTAELLNEDYFGISLSLSSKTKKQMLFPSFSSLDPPKMMWNSGLESKTRKLQKAVPWPVLPGSGLWSPFAKTRILLYPLLVPSYTHL